MNIFKKAKLRESRKVFSNCHQCGNEFEPDKRNTNRGWGLFCSKSCSAKFRNKKKTKADIRDYKLKQLNIK